MAGWRAGLLVACVIELGCDVGFTSVAFDCGPNDVPTDTGECQTVGVLPGSCAAVGAPDGRGGCVVGFDDAADELGELSLPGGVRSPLCVFDEDPAHPGYPRIPHEVVQPSEGEQDDPIIGDLPRVYVEHGATSLRPSIAKAEKLLLAGRREGRLPPDPVLVVVPPGTYEGDVVLRLPILLFGSCPDRTRLVGQGVEPAVLTVRPGVIDTGAGFLSIEGPGDGVRVGAGASFGTSALVLEDLPGAGIRGDERADVRFQSSIVRRAGEAGIEVAGGKIQVADSVIRDTETGIWMRESPSGDAGTLNVWRSVVAHGRTAGLRVDGAAATVESSVVLDTRHGPGIRVRRGVAFGTAASITLGGSVVDGSHDAGVDVANAALTLTSSTVRNTSGRSDASTFRSDGFAGHGVRIATTVPEIRSRIESSLITHSRGAGLIALAGSVEVADTIIRETRVETATGDFGDGLAAFPGAQIRLERVRIDGSARASLGLFGIDVDVDSSAFGCSAEGLATEPFGEADRGAVSGVESSVCGCDGVWARCQPGARGLEPWVWSQPQ